MTEAASAPNNGLHRNAWQRWKRRWAHMVRAVEHGAILARSREEATFSAHYAFMVAVAAGIATIGLLLNSPAVIIGAMLVSPLMGPIVASGFAIAGVDVAMGRRALGTLLAGALIAVLVATGIAWLSPVNEFTAELAARTRPNLFDLVVAVLSGAAGGYALIRGHGGTIVGVAIATALMPPLATLGYGVATWQAPVARGAAMLFITNMAAIALAVAGMAVWYGFGRGELRQRFALQALISVLVLAPLAVPLSISLRGIVWESRVHAAVRTVLDEGARELPQGQLAQVKVRFGDSRSAQVDAIVVSARPQPGLQARLNERLAQATRADITLHLTQLRADDPEAARLAAREGTPVATPPPAPAPPPPDPAVAWQGEFPLPMAAIQVDGAARTVRAHATARAGVTLAAWQAIEAEVAARHAGWQVQLVPPPAGLPAIGFDRGTAVLDARAQQRLALIAWALERWQLGEVRLTGRASTSGQGTLALARRRLQAVSQWFALHGVAVQGEAFYPAPLQVQAEREAGEQAFRVVEVGLVATAGADAAALPPPAARVAR